MQEGDSAGSFGVAVVGCGYWGVNYLRLLRELPQVKAVYAFDPRAERLAEVADRFPHVSPLESFDAVLESPEVDAAIVCTPATQHYEVAAPLLDSGKHLLIEKPITTRSASRRSGERSRT